MKVIHILPPISLALALIPSLAQAQLTPDNSLGAESSVVTPHNPTTDHITGGAARGSNLFHSFGEFNVDASRSVYFANPPAIENILTRVTGGNQSNIMGTLGVLGDANLFLVNPNGIVFGPSARLDIRGSFFATTGDGIRLGENGLFSATDLDPSKLLHVRPEALFTNALANQMARLNNRGNLAVGTGSALVLHGGEVRNSGSLTAPGGTVMVLGEQIGLLDNARIDVSSFTGGGRVFLGGFLGGRGNIPTAEGTYIGPDVRISANAAFRGDGGNVYVWADGVTRFYGNISARGGLSGGDGGFVKLSGARRLIDRGDVDTTAARGNPGTLLLDPPNINGEPSMEIEDAQSIPSDIFNNSSKDVTIDSSQLEELSPQTNVVLQETNDIVVKDLALEVLSLAPGTREATGQIVPDETLGAESSVVTLANINGISSDSITGGSIRGANLFHSFSQFSIREGEAAYFANPATIENILTRVTGSNGSNIFGTLGVLGNAKLFLINPNGIVFGPNASLDLGGSFVGSSANSLIFDNGFEFSATDPQGPPLLTIDIPIGLNLTANPGSSTSLTASSIVVEGPGNNLREEFFVTVRDDRPPGLQVPPGLTLALVGGDLLLSGGNLTAEDGTVALWSVLDGSLQLTTSNGQLSLENSQSTTWGDIRLEEAASVDVSGNGGNVQVRGRRVQLTDGSAIIADTLGNSSGGIVTVEALESVELIGMSAGGNYASRFSMAVGPGATGDGGNLTISTGRLTLKDGTFILNGTFGAGNAGNVTVRATDIEMNGPKDFFVSGLLAGVGNGATGDGGFVRIETDRLVMRDGARIETSTFGMGKAGNIQVEGTEVEVIGISGDGRLTSGLFASVQEGATGEAGNLKISIDRLIVRDGAQIGVSTQGIGNAGNIYLRGTEVEIIGTSTDGRFPSGLYAGVGAGARGEAGNLKISTDRLVVRDGAQIAAITLGIGNAGNIHLRGTEVEIIGTSTDGRFASGLFASVESGARGKAGDLTIEIDRLIVQDGARVSTGTFGDGDGGTLTVRSTSSVELRGTSVAGFPSLIITGTGSQEASVNGGNLTIDTARLMVEDGGQISAETIGSGKAGNVIIQASESIELMGASPEVRSEEIFQSEFVFGSQGVFPSGILASSRGTGDAGNIELKTGQLSVRDGATVTVSSEDAGPAGNLTIAAEDIDLDRGTLRAETPEANRGSITIDAVTIVLRNDSAILTDAVGGATGGNITISTENLVAMDNSDISASAIDRSGGNIFITASGLFLDNDSEITATGSDRRVIQREQPQGIVSLAEAPVDPESLISKGCEEYRGSEFIITGRGGIPPHPFETLPGEVIWLDWRALTDENSALGYSVPDETSPVESEVTPEERELADDEIRQAQGWLQLPDGTVVLTAYPVKMTPVAPVMQHPGCQIILGDREQ